MRVFDWKARRVGAAITISGKDSGGDAVKLAGVRSIEPRGEGVVAIDGNGEAHNLVLA